MMYFGDDESRYRQWRLALEDTALVGTPLIRVKRAESWGQLGANEYALKAGDFANYEVLMKELAGRSSDGGWLMVHAFALDDSAEPELDADASSRWQAVAENGVMSLFGLGRALVRARGRHAMHVQHVFAGRGDLSHAVRTAASGLNKSLTQISPRVTVTTVDLSEAEAGTWGEWMAEETVRGTAEAGEELRYTRGERQRRRLELIPAERRGVVSGALQPGTYLVTGGSGELGMLFARHLVTAHGASVILVGRRPLAGEIERRVVELQALGRVRYESLDIADAAAVEAMMGRVRANGERLRGVVHAAGVVSSNWVDRKERSELERVLRPKVQGTLVLDEATRAESLDVFVLFSSTSALLGDVGQGDYAVANRFLDSFAAWREQQRARGRRAGRTLSLNWPLWRDGGMHVDRAREELYLRNNNLVYLEASAGLAAFERAISHDAPQIVVLPPGAVLERPATPPVRATATPPVRATAAAARPSTAPSLVPVEDAATLDRMRSFLVGLLASKLQLAASQIVGHVALGDYGVDSIIMGELIEALEDRLGRRLEPSLLLEHPSVDELSRYLVEHYGVPEVCEPETARVSVGASKAQPSTPQPAPRTEPKVEHTSIEAPIAVIGLACHFPGAADSGRLWQNLIAGQSSIREVPASRWDARRFYDPSPRPGKTYSKWGGFIEQLEEFDPRPFSIPDNEAAQFDPSIRKVLEVTVDLLREAGYERQELWQRKVGAFIGARIGNYATRIQRPQKQTVIGVGQNFIAAYLSHVFNFRGPNLVVDSACSSSLVAVHLACQSLRAGECELAVAGGVDILLDEKLYLVLSEGKALSPDGRCHTFDRAANGFVPGEGCGAVLLKPLERAVADGDRIFAVVLGSAVNNDGHTMGVTTPNMEAQKDVVREALTRSGVDPATLSYVETHGTGTMIGDPIELKALTEVFRAHTDAARSSTRGGLDRGLGVRGPVL